MGVLWDPVMGQRSPSKLSEKTISTILFYLGFITGCLQNNFGLLKANSDTN